MLTSVALNNRVQWSTLTVQDIHSTAFIVNAGIAIVQDKMIDVMLNYVRWHGYRYLDGNVYKIGYGIGDSTKEQGYTEPEAYAEWLGDLRNKQKIVRAQLPVVGIPISTFDALVSLYIDTGSWRTLVSPEGTYNVADAVKNSDWTTVADMLSRGSINPALRRQEARISFLGDYSANMTRRQQITFGIQSIRKEYVRGITNDFEKKQAEFAYFRQLGVFLPGMSQLRQRRIVSQAVA